MNVSASVLNEFPISLVDRQTGKPATNARLILDTKPEPIVLRSDSSGQVMVPVTRDLLAVNPVMRAEPAGIDTVVSLTATIHGQIEDVEVSSALELKKIGDANVAVFSEPEDAALARKVLAELMRARKEVRRLLGLEPERWAVIVGPKRKRDVLYMTVPASGYESTWMCFREEWETGEFMRTNVHEWVESTIESRLALYSDPRNRFIGDGLAEYASWRLYGLGPEYRDRLSPAAVPQETVDLLTAFQAVPGSAFHRRKFDRGIAKHGYSPGYALAFVFWHDLLKEHGTQVPARMVANLAQQRPVTVERAIATLEAITGEQGLEEQLRNSNVADARNTIARLR
tara:strand:+ start:5652 stop:6677 length:1026 start_codon:yes stop_codon:yes gene_type:complete